MSKRKPSPIHTAGEIRQMLKSGGSAEHASGVQWFFKEEVKSRGWYTVPLRRAARVERKKILKERGPEFLLKVADQLFSGNILEEKIFAVLLLEKLTGNFGDREFKIFESWLSRISSWADHDGLVHCLIAPMVAAKPARMKCVCRWAKSKDRWHRRAACVALIQGRRQGEFFAETTRLANLLLADEDDMVRKGLGWLLRVTASVVPRQTVPYLMRIRGKISRLVLRTACETLPVKARKRVLS